MKSMLIFIMFAGIILLLLLVAIQGYWPMDRGDSMKKVHECLDKGLSYEITYARDPSKFKRQWVTRIDCVPINDEETKQGE